MPDIELDNVTLTRGEESSTRLKEADLAGHLENPEGTNGAEEDISAAKKAAAETDYGLSEALNLLKGLAILRPGSA